MTQPTKDGFQVPDPAVLTAEAGAGARTLFAEEVTSAAVALRKHHDQLMALPGVVMIGETQDQIGRPAILIGVKAMPDLERLPRSIDGVPVLPEVIGEVDAYQADAGE